MITFVTRSDGMVAARGSLNDMKQLRQYMEQWRVDGGPGSGGERGEDGRYSGGGSNGAAGSVEDSKAIGDQWQKAVDDSDREKESSAYNALIENKYPGATFDGSGQEGGAVERYTGAEYKQINDQLTSGSHEDPEYDEIGQAVSAYCDTNKLVSDTLLYRGMSSNITLNPGDQLDFKGIGSFSSSAIVAKSFTNTIRGSILMIEGKKGQPFAPVGELSAQTQEGNNEMEYLLKPGSKLECVGKGTVGGLDVYKMRYKS